MPFSRQRLQKHMAHFGYVLIDTPVIEPASLFLTKAGDQIIEHLFSFEHNGQHYALRPEFTASAANRYVKQHLEGVVRWQFNGPVFEDMPELAGQHWEYISVGAELIGMAGSDADAEMMSMAATGLTAQGLVNW
ncbi:MAG TPA: ATP phosphoribosyltransferase regulatory subunit, partial [Phototrophicaceae bacterium]|nr:ATP phosphoribosyltransferase regulatory subunit [Phototrophicaceae bacterium]